MQCLRNIIVIAELEGFIVLQCSFAVAVDTITIPTRTLAGTKWEIGDVVVRAGTSAKGITYLAARKARPRFINSIYR